MKQTKLLPPVYFLIFLAIIFCLHYFLPLFQLIHPPYNYLGIFPIVIAIFFSVFSARFFVKSGTPVKPFQEPNCLVTEGLHKYSRNPMYLSLVLILFGVFLLLGSLSPLFAIPFFIRGVVKKFITYEESILEEKFGKAYLDYKQKVRRWI